MIRIVLVGLMFGDEGKGRWSDYFSGLFSSSIIVRFTGANQGGHYKKVGNSLFCFSNFGSGMFNPGCKTYISPYTLVHPRTILDEAVELEKRGVVNIFERFKIHRDARVITDVHSLVCRMREIARGDHPNGSTGMGVGEATIGVAVHVRDFFNETNLRRYLRGCFAEKLDIARQLIDANRDKTELREIYLDFLKDNPETGKSRLEDSYEFYRYFAINFGNLIVDDSYWEGIYNTENLVFEGTQGTLIDKEFGFKPHITRTRTTTINAEAILGNLSNGTIFIGIIRAYTTRHGPGPFPTRKIDLGLKESVEGKSRWNGISEPGYLDLVLAKYGLQSNHRIDYLVVSCLDRLLEMPEIKICVSYEYTGTDFNYLDSFFEWNRLSNRKIRITTIKPREDLTEAEHLVRTRMMFNCKPLDFVSFSKWNMDISDIRDFSQLPIEAKEYIKFIEEQLAVPVCMVSVGPSREQVVVLKDIF